MIRRLSDFSDLSGYRLPFVVIRPYRLKYRDISLRIHDLRWPTLKFHVKSGHSEFRVKEFFLDWFFPGFPKSLLRDFSSTYSKVSDVVVSGYRIFLGKNYRGSDSASAYINGTQVEVECREGAEPSGFQKVFEDMLSQRVDPSRLSGYQFPDRSHFAKGYETSWYEESRVSRLTWFRTPRKIFRIQGHELRSSGMGRIDVNGKVQEMYILEEREYRNAIRIEFADSQIQLDHAFYNVRGGNNFFDLLEEMPDKDVRLVFRSPEGPGMLRFMRMEKVWTVGFSPGYSKSDMIAFMDGIDEIDAFLSGLRQEIPYAEA